MAREEAPNMCGDTLRPSDFFRFHVILRLECGALPATRGWSALL